MKTVLTLFGTRPEVIKLAPVVAALETRGARLRTLNVASSQHADLLRPFARRLSLRIDRDLDVMRPGQTPSEVCARVLAALDPLLAERRPHLILVQGDTTTALAGALAGFHRRIPVGHVEAGLRTGHVESPFPEEMNRRLITQLARFHFAATPHNVRTLESEGIGSERIALTGNPVVDALHTVLGSAPPSPPLTDLLDELDGHRVIALTTHRRESFGEVMEGHLEVLRRFVERHPDTALVFPVHPNPSVRETTKRVLDGAKRVHLIEPLEYPDFIHLLASAWLIATDSGGVQEEAPTVGTPVLILREHTERPEAVACGIAKLVGNSRRRLASLLEEAYAGAAWFGRAQQVENPFGTGNSGECIASAIEDFLKVHAEST